jgi:rubredoxin
MTETIYFNFKGGIISPGHLKEILGVAEAVQAADLRFGLRQQLIMDVPAEKFEKFSAGCAEKNIEFSTEGKHYPNLVSSYLTANIFTQDSWLSEGVYKDVFDLFHYQPRLKVNICDSKQSFTPLFTGHLNWVASVYQHYWYLHIRFPGSHRVFCWPELIYTNDLGNFSVQLERLLLTLHQQNPVADHPELDILMAFIKQTVTYISRPVTEKLAFPSFKLPYYEGFNREGNSYWLGIYRRDETFSLPFLKELCNLCLQQKIGAMHATAWKSLLIKDIALSSRRQWDQLLDRYRINVRHAANELNWQVEDKCEDGLILKRHVIRYFDKEDVRTFGLCFAVKTRETSHLFGTIVIRRQQRKNPNKLKSLERFDILYKKDFNPNGTELILFREQVEKDYLGTYLVSLCKFYYETHHIESSASTMEVQDVEVKTAPVKEQEWIHQCGSCFTVYDSSVDDEDNKVAAGTAFDDVPETYQCSLCGADKSAFIKVERSAIYN